jgi:hypothetical protein
MEIRRGDEQMIVTKKERNDATRDFEKSIRFAFRDIRQLQQFRGDGDPNNRRDPWEPIGSPTDYVGARAQLAGV